MAARIAKLAARASNFPAHAPNTATHAPNTATHAANIPARAISSETRRFSPETSEAISGVLLTLDTTPNYTDTTPFPSTPKKWTHAPSTASAIPAWDNGASR